MTRVKTRQPTEVNRDGTGANVLGDPRIALTWLANQLSSLGITLQKGHGDHGHLHGANGTSAG